MRIRKIGRRREERAWTDEELRAILAVYLDMLELELRGKPYSKSRFREHLLVSSLRDRSKKSYEMRMMNVSWVLQRFDCPHIRGYKPLSNVGRSVRQRLENMLTSEFRERLDAVLATVPTADEELLERRTHILLERPDSSALPREHSRPCAKKRESMVYERSPEVKAWVLRKANGLCEACGMPAPFKTSGGMPYLETHHLVPLSRGGSDGVRNVIAVCPNCHRRLHHGDDAERFREEIVSRLIRLREGRR